ncbi:MAG: YggS family pyridoxal phosphate-dependent enzyme [Marinilabiliaceae bacterium]|nr:YggS family pyridoxal phosphate-dependent enzyme [Marinilabiliaceae bacterium]
MTTISENLKIINNFVTQNVKLVAVSKAQSLDTIMDAYTAGHRIFGENKVQEILLKRERLPDDILWHFIGHLQTNKVKQIVSFVDLIQGVDSLKLLEYINKESKKINRTVKCLLQIHIADEMTKFGFSEEELFELLKSGVINSLENITICGLMGMATFTDNTQQIRKEFKNLKRIFDSAKNNYFFDNDNFTELSMGMSDDFKIAIEEGSTMIRVGSSIFGLRKYN